MNNLVRKVKQIMSHRNGVAGEGFFTVLFSGTGKDEKEMMATVFDSTKGLWKTHSDSKSIRVAVVNLGDLKDGKIERMYRGDDYNYEIITAIKKLLNEKGMQEVMP